MDESVNALPFASNPIHSPHPPPRKQNVKLIAMRSAGTNNVDMDHIIQKQYTELSVVHVPAYSPNAVAEHSLAMLMTLNRRTHKVI